MSRAVAATLVSLVIPLLAAMPGGDAAAGPPRRAAPMARRSAARPSTEASRPSTFAPGAARSGVENVAPRGETQAERELQDAISLALGSRWMKQAVNGILVLDVRTGKTLFSFGADRQLNPASNVKLVSTCTALDALGPEFSYTTRLLGASPEGGQVAGDVYLLGSWDPLLRPADLQRLAMAVADKGVKRINGALVVSDLDRRDSLGYPAVRVSVVGGEKNGQPAQVSVEPAPDLFVVKSLATTSSKGRRPRLSVSLAPLGDKIAVTVSGRVRPGQQATLSKTLARGPWFTAHVLAGYLKDAGVEVTGGIRHQPTAPEGLTELAAHRSVSLSKIVAWVNKPSDNWLADRVIWTTGKELYGGEIGNSVAVRAMEAFLDKLGIERGTYRLDNGSGLSHTNHLSARQLVQVLLHGYRSARISSDFLASLSVAGVDGTLRGRMRGHLSQGHVFGKTGTLYGVSTLSGFVTTEGGDTLVFAILSNGFRDRRKNSIRAAHHDMVNAMYRYLTLREPPLPFAKF